ncbi:hypothetical protein [Actinacidiphila rubida]|uniref:Uncharacterized protein n=1 Tax=Actinacidiphila rubida TaxID=310780 RepID=A0A1H8K944_9ACTN|nr:hypothetical protein [Actinacidiphila rubida]SEN89231.1 hypothetical protein SAMN05216267_101254 [Actinacidiphila rubida]
MIPATHSAHSIETTAESLRDELGRLEVQKQALERELAAVVAHLGSVRQALGALQVLMAENRPAASHETAPAGHGEHVDTTGTAPPRPRREATTPPPPSAPVADDGHGQYGSITDQILEYFVGIGDADVRARDVAAALGRDTGNGSINAVRSTLDRLVGASRLQRTGRGLYHANNS